MSLRTMGYPSLLRLMLAIALSPIVGCGSGEATGDMTSAGSDGRGMGGGAGEAVGRGGAPAATGGTTGAAGGPGGGGGDVASCQAGMPDGGAAVAGLPDNVVFFSNVVVTTLTGGPNAGAQDGTPAVATFGNPVGIAIEPTGAVVVSTFDDSKLRRISSGGVTSTLTDQASFIRPYGVGALGGVLYVATDADPSSGSHGPQNGTMWRVDTATGAATVVKANTGKPRAFAPLSDGRLVVSDASNSTVWILDPATGGVTELAGRAGCPGSAEGIGTEARFVLPSGIVVLAGDRIIVADRGAHVLREIAVTGGVTTFAGDGGAGTIDGPRTSARFSGPRGLTADASGALYVSDDVDHRIRRIDVDGTVTTLAGTGTAGFADGPGSLAQFFGQEGVAVTADGRTVYVADGTGGSETPVPYHRIRQITLAP